MENRKWYWFMATNKWAIFMNLMKILTFILLAWIVFILVTEIEIFKQAGGDVCKICMEKTGCQCYCLNLPV